MANLRPAADEERKASRRRQEGRAGQIESGRGRQEAKYFPDTGNELGAGICLLSIWIQRLWKSPAMIVVFVVGGFVCCDGRKPGAAVSVRVPFSGHV